MNNLSAHNYFFDLFLPFIDEGSLFSGGSKGASQRPGKEVLMEEEDIEVDI